MLLVHLFVYFTRVNLCPFSLPLGVGGWLWLVIMALPGLFINVFEILKENLICEDYDLP